MIELSWKIKLGKINYLLSQNVKLKGQNILFIGTETKMDDEKKARKFLAYFYQQWLYVAIF